MSILICGCNINFSVKIASNEGLQLFKHSCSSEDWSSAYYYIVAMEYVRYVIFVGCSELTAEVCEYTHWYGRCEKGRLRNSKCGSDSFSCDT